ncbi:hypothetical protein KIL84_001855 [Mauremys mutica]|uniref:Uncharacterized protein n=1 Tax=Mauremys mutica TaxID=74926 RepID=A0A9D3XJX4_9SAUR|nr:hypothetical protein KIL84_001855 [Mauremys mutica]
MWTSTCGPKPFIALSSRGIQNTSDFTTLGSRVILDCPSFSTAPAPRYVTSLQNNPIKIYSRPHSRLLQNPQHHPMLHSRIMYGDPTSPSPILIHLILEQSRSPNMIIQGCPASLSEKHYRMIQTNPASL